MTTLAGTSGLLYVWSYWIDEAGPNAIAENSESLTFNFWEYNTGTYRIRLKMTDPNNAAYYMEVDSRSFNILQSCFPLCDSINWKFEFDPGTCSPCNNCFNNLSVDTCDLQIIPVDSHYEITLKYDADSIGGNTISIYPNNWTNPRNNVDCGLEIKFPSIELDEDVPGSCMNSGIDIVLSGAVTTNGLISGTNSDYSISWIQPGTICDDGFFTCIIPSGSMTDGGPEIFKLQLKMNCQSSPVVWDQVQFTPFGFWPIYTPTTQGSVQTITFSEPVNPADGLNCNNILLDIGGLGTGTICKLSTATTLLIKYGHDMPSGSFTLNFKPAGFISCVQGLFTRANFPTFNLNSTSNEDPSAHQDFILTLFVADIVNEGSVTLTYEWLIKEAPSGSYTALDVPNTIETERVIKYKDISRTNYTIKVIMRDPANTNFYYEREYTGIEIKLSCQVDCDTIIWKFSHNPGTCAENCIMDSNQGDTYEITQTGSSSPYEIRMRYLPGSVGGVYVKPNVPNWSNNLDTTLCGAEIRFSTITLNEDAPDCVATGSPLTLSVTLDSNSLTQGDNYTLNWVRPAVIYCNTESISCTIPPANLSGAGGPQVFMLQLIIPCTVSPDPWIQVPFNYFDKAVIFTLITVGAVQTLTFSANLALLGGNDCLSLLQDISALGDGTLCSLHTDGTAMTIKYGPQTTSDPLTLNLRHDSYILYIYNIDSLHA